MVEEKKVLVMASGKFDVNGNTITLKPGTTHTENSFVPTADVVSVVSPSGTQEFEVKENGFYLLNLKKDTVSGAYPENRFERRCGTTANYTGKFKVPYR